MSSVNPHRPPFAPAEDYTGPKRALILAGGGMRVAYHAGALLALYDAGLRFAHVDGTSGGIINTAMVLSGESPVEMCDRWRTLNLNDAISLMPFEEYLKGSHMMAMCSSDGVINKMFPHLGVDIHKINAAEGITGTFNVCNFTRKTNEAIQNDRVDIDLIVAGMSLPIFMPPVKKGDVWYTDSVWLKDANLMEAVKRGAEELWVLWIINNTSEFKTGAFNQYVHMIEMSANGSLIDEFERINEINERIKGGEKVFGHARPIRVHLIKPGSPLPLDPDLFLNHITTAGLIDMGYADAKQYLNAVPLEGLPLVPETLMMKPETKPGVSFRETMVGGFSLNETDPTVGEKKGDDAGTKLSLHCEIDIEDVYGFMSDPDHTTPIKAHIDFPPLGMNIPGSNAIFNLFKPGQDDKTKYFIYEVAFELNNQPYYLAGRKVVHDDPGLDMWKDITTLFTRLHQGRDQTGPVVGAGTIYIHREQLIAMIPTFRATHTSSAIESAKVLADFGRFFMGEIWDSYWKP